ncbi:ABC transporter permease subunit [Sporosarcina gallistercoris]|uniref:ABC transporter permease subunit n=1 Tax=Sporosarcina gallistercoris TaxID=2762245 RepID=A0ABR8PLT0_9BACL|nr:ABC transporter permease subunit [Sporosarcina gallistercoris]MBD7909135.1 ABC transporter permease subunit [Sporosarcina gallistercoris]
MSPWLGFLKKEWTESVKSYKLLLTVLIFSVIGILNPFTAKITPMLMENFMPEGAVLNLPEPTALDSWLQFYKNFPQMGLFIFILLFSTMMSKELEKGTLVILLTKGLRRSTVITTKFIMGIIYWTLAFLLTFFITYSYTAFYWDQSILEHLFLAAGCVYVFGILLFTITLWGNTYFASAYGGLLVTVMTVIALFVIAIFPDSATWNPLQLLSAPPQLITGAVASKEILTPFLVATGAILFFLIGTILHFNKKRL